MPCRALEVTHHRRADRRAEGGRAALSRSSRVAVKRHQLRTGGFERHRVVDGRRGTAA